MHKLQRGSLRVGSWRSQLRPLSCGSVQVNGVGLLHHMPGGHILISRGHLVQDMSLGPVLNLGREFRLLQLPRGGGHLIDLLS